MKITPILLLTTVLFHSAVEAAVGVQHVRSAHSVAITADRLAAALEAKGMTLFGRIDHAAGAANLGKTLPPTQLLIFGNPKVGTPLMQCDRGVAIDLPQKALIWEDDEGKVWLTYNDPAYLARRHHLADCAGVLNKIAGALARFANTAAAP